jgi:hypothetical protein
MYTQLYPPRQEIPSPEFVAVTATNDSVITSDSTSYFYSYRFRSKEGDCNLTPEWWIANLYHCGIKVTDLWYARSSTPKRPTNISTGTLYPPFLVVRLDKQDSYMEHLYFIELKNFDPIETSKKLNDGLMHYIPK